MALPSAGAPDRRTPIERSTDRLADRLGPEGYVVRPDGVVIGPTGVSVVTTLACTDRLRVHHGELWHGRFPCRAELAAGRRRVERTRAAVDRFDPDVPVRAFVCVVGSPVPEDPYRVLDVELSDPVALPDLVRAAPAVLQLDEVLHLAGDLEPAARRSSGWRPSRWRRR